MGRNQYIDLMNSARSRKGIFPLPGIFGNRRGRELLPERPVDTMTILPWWTVQVGYVTEEDINKAAKILGRISEDLRRHSTGAPPVT